jgi:hypothetical protein
MKEHVNSVFTSTLKLEVTHFSKMLVTTEILKGITIQKTAVHVLNAVETSNLLHSDSVSYTQLPLLLIYSFLYWNPTCCNWYRKTWQGTIISLYKQLYFSVSATVIGFGVYVKVKPYKCGVRNLKHFLYLDKCRVQSNVAGCDQLDCYSNSAPHQDF